ncbi:hypothetical protein PspLS_07346 [Pyricularia sp. CBS 133598]|nr:hypothetical protein PspLS_07346 [Pyricularia sp. CBS 133598]
MYLAKTFNFLNLLAPQANIAGAGRQPSLCFVRIMKYEIPIHGDGYARGSDINWWVGDQEVDFHINNDCTIERRAGTQENKPYRLDSISALPDDLPKGFEFVLFREKKVDEFLAQGGVTKRVLGLVV